MSLKEAPFGTVPKLLKLLGAIRDSHPIFYGLEFALLVVVREEEHLTVVASPRDMAGNFKHNHS